jgi:hypothetical protein
VKGELWITTGAGSKAKRALAAGRRGDAEGFARHQNLMLDLLEGAPYPYLTATDFVRRIGRSKAMVLKIERRIINLAL